MERTARRMPQRAGATEQMLLICRLHPGCNGLCLQQKVLGCNARENGTFRHRALRPAAHPGLAGRYRRPLVFRAFRFHALGRAPWPWQLTDPLSNKRL
jgi:hypothetical protein